jgi:O-acetyl-ADP-ribose deacetylase (regulator of RNase III)
LRWINIAAARARHDVPAGAGPGTRPQGDDMIKEVSGDILLSGAQAIAHGVAPHDHFASGLALSLRERWPAMYKDFRHYCQNHHVEPGGLWAWAGTDVVRLVALFTQEPAAHDHGHPGKAHVEHVNHALRALHKLALKEKFRSLALPRLATGVGGLEWDAVRPLLDTHLGSLDMPVIVYRTYQAGVKAAE